MNSPKLLKTLLNIKIILCFSYIKKTSRDVAGILTDLCLSCSKSGVNYTENFKIMFRKKAALLEKPKILKFKYISREGRF